MPASDLPSLLMPPPGWLTDADAAFAAARERDVPLFLYWNIGWCPPCSRLNGTLFADPAFTMLAAAFVPLFADGDAPGAQQLAERLRLRSYPSLVVYRADGREITRLPCELDAPRLLALLRIALDGAAASDTPRTLQDWQLLAHYAWDTDEGQLLKGRDLAATLAGLRAACPDPVLAARMDWLAGDARAATGPVHPDLLIHHAAALAQAHRATAPALLAALVRLEADPGVHVLDRLAALRTRARIAPPPHDLLRELLRTRIASALEEATTPPLRHAALNTAAGMLAEAGLAGEAELLLTGALAGSHAPYYFMQTLAGLARQRGDAGAALDWHERAWHAARGPSTRLQWGVNYLLALDALAPGDARIDALASVLRAAGVVHQRDRSQLERVRSLLER